MIKKINVIDLDHTLVNYDSFRELIKIQLFKFDIYIIWITLLRLLKIKNRYNYKMEIIKYFENIYDNQYFKKFAVKVFNDIDRNIFNLINEETDDDTINILLSASPTLYVRHIIKKLSWEGTGSYIDENGFFFHMQGDSKITWLIENYNQIEYKYNFAISDDDFNLLNLFEKNKVIN